MPRPIAIQPVVDLPEKLANDPHEPSTDYPTLPDGTVLPPPYNGSKTYTKLELFQFTLFHNKNDVMRAIQESHYGPKRSSFQSLFPGKNVPFDNEDVKLLLSVCDQGSEKWHDRVERIVAHRHHAVRRDVIFEITGYSATLSLCTKEELIKLVEQLLKNEENTHNKFLAAKKKQPNSKPFDSMCLPCVPPRTAQNAHEKQPTYPSQRAATEWHANIQLEELTANQAKELLDDIFSGDRATLSLCTKEELIKLVEQGIINGTITHDKFLAVTRKKHPASQKGGDDKASGQTQTAINGIYIPPAKTAQNAVAGGVKQPTNEKAQGGEKAPAKLHQTAIMQRTADVAAANCKDGSAVTAYFGGVVVGNGVKETKGGVIDQNAGAAATSTPKRKLGSGGPCNKKQKGMDGAAVVPFHQAMAFYHPDGAFYHPAGAYYHPAWTFTTEASATVGNNAGAATVENKKVNAQIQEKPKSPGTGIYADIPEPEWLEHRFAFDLFRSRHNGANPSSKSDDLNECKLAKWAQQQERCRLQVIDGTADSLTKAKVESLRQIPDFPFFSNKVRGYIEQLKEYKKEHGHINVPRNEGDGLGGWLSRCRRKNGPGTTDPDLKAILEGMGWRVGRFQYQWEKNFEKMKEFKEKYGHCKVLREGDQKLYSWSLRQRSDYNDGRLSQEYIEKLNSIGFIWKSATKNNPLQLVEELKAFKEEHGHFNVKSVDNHNLYTWLSFLRTKYRDGTVDESLHTKLEEIGFDWTKQIDNRIKDRLYELRTFKEEHGHCQVFGSGRLKLSKWLSSCKMRHRMGTLEKELGEELEEIGVEWIQWDVLYELLKGYYEQHGHCNLTSSSLNNIEYRKLRSWVKYQRLNYHEGTMSADRISKLEELGINWSLDDCGDQAGEPDLISTMSQKDQTEEYIKRLKAFKDQHGNCNISKTSDGKLGQWVEKLRRKHKTGMLDKDLQARCEEIGLQWSQWDEMFKQLQEYKELHGDCHVPYKRHEGYEYIHLGRWCCGLRGSYRKGKLAQDRIDRLNEIGFVWLEYNPIDWADMLQQMREFKEEHGHPNVPKGYPPNKRLARWVQRQRTLYSKGQLKQERYDALDELGFTFSFK